MVIMVRVTDGTDGTPTRHYVMEGFEVALCDTVTHRVPTWLDHRSESCSPCRDVADELHRRGGI